MQYHNVDLLILAGGGDFSVRLATLGFGEARTSLKLNSLISDSNEIRKQINSLFSPSQKDRRAIQEAIQTECRAFGQRLFEAVCPAGGPRRIVERVFAETRDGRTGLRFRVQYAGVPQASEVLWELLYWPYPGPENYLANDLSCSIVRYLDVSDAPRSTQVTELPLRILGLIADDTKKLDTDQEKDNLEKAFRLLSKTRLLRQPLVEAEFLLKGDVEHLQKSLDRAVPCHVFHFIGHSDGERLRLEGDSEQVDSTEDVLRLLGSKNSLSLAVLNSCEGALPSASDPFSGIAQKLVKQSVPAVVGMQFPITDNAAIRFSQQFYERLAESRTVDEAVASGRRALLASRSAEWATPALYMRAVDGQIFRIQTRPSQMRKRVGQVAVAFLMTMFTILSFVFGVIPSLPPYRVLLVRSATPQYQVLDEELETGVRTALRDADGEFGKFFHKPIHIDAVGFEAAVERLNCSEWRLLNTLCNLRVLAIFAPPASTDAMNFLASIPRDLGRPIFLVGSNPGLTNPVADENAEQRKPVRRKDVFRLTPNDYQQAQTIVDFIWDQAKQRAAKRDDGGRSERSGSWRVSVIRDSQNPVYASGLSKLVKEGFDRCKGSCPEVTFPSSQFWEEEHENGEEDPTMRVSTEDLGRMRKEEVEALIYIGAPESARAFLDRIDRVGWDPVVKLLSDSSVNRRFIEKADRPELLEGVCGVFPRGADKDNIQAPALESGQPGFQLFAWDAIGSVLLQSLQLMHESRLAILDRTTVTSVLPPDLLQALNDGRERREVSGAAAGYLFDSFGNNRRARYHVWQIRERCSWQIGNDCVGESTYAWEPIISEVNLVGRR